MSSVSSALDRYFGISERGSDIATEVKGGIITFLAMVYILAVNPGFFSASGASSGALFTSTALAAIISCILMGIYARFPVALAPGMGVNAFLAYTVCGTMGFTYAQGLLAVFLSGVLFFVLSVTGARAKMMEAFPLVLRCSFTAGIGFFIALIGLHNAGIIVSGFPLSLANLGDTKVLLGIFAIALTLILWFRNVWGSVLIGIIVTVILSLALGLTDLPESITSSPDFSLVGEAFGSVNDFAASDVAPFVAAVIALAVMDMFDTTGTLMAVIDRAKGNSGVSMGNFNKALEVDSVATIAGALVGTSTTTSFIESCSGIESGARTGLMPIVTGLMFTIALFLCPLFGVVTYTCVVGALVLVGILMFTAIKEIDWADRVNVATAFMTIFFIGMSGSITDGMAFGTLTYIVAMTVTKRFSEIHKIILLLGVIFLAYFILYYGYIL